MIRYLIHDDAVSDTGCRDIREKTPAVPFFPDATGVSITGLYIAGLEQGNSNLSSQATRIREPSFVPLPIGTGYAYHTGIQRSCR